LTDAGHPSGTISRTFVVDDAGRAIKLTVAGDPNGANNATYVIVWNGHGDATGLWRVKTDGTLEKANTFGYDSWGRPSRTVYGSYTDLGFRYLYVGASDVQWDDAYGAGLHYMHARHYSPTLGRFLQPDPAAAEGNLYGYAGNNPVTNVDPEGRFWGLIIRIVVRYGPAVARWLGIGPAAAVLCQRYCLTTVNLAHILAKHSQSLSSASLRTRPGVENATKFLDRRPPRARSEREMV